MADVDKAAAEAALGEPVEDVGGEAEAPFYEYGDGESKLSFKTADELKAHLDKSTNWDKDYTKKSQANAELKRQLEQQRSEFEKSKSEWEQNEKSKYDRYQEALSKRPAIAEQLAKMVDQPVTPDESFQRAQGYADTRYKELEERLASFEAAQEQERLEREREAIYADLEKEYPDFNRDKVNDALQNLDGNDLKSLIMMVHKSANYNPVEMQEKVEQNIAKKQGVGMMPTGAGVPAPKNKGSTDPKIAREEAMEWATSG
jgi:hypothetical protein